MILLAIVGYVLSLIPFITMYTLTEEDHEGHIGVLKIRAALEDYATGALSVGQLEEAKQIYTSALTQLEELEAQLPAATGNEKRQIRRMIKACRSSRMRRTALTIRPCSAGWKRQKHC